MAKKKEFYYYQTCSILVNNETIDYGLRVTIITASQCDIDNSNDVMIEARALHRWYYIDGLQNDCKDLLPMRTMEILFFMINREEVKRPFILILFWLINY